MDDIRSELPPLQPNVIRGLGDKIYDKRKSAAFEIER
jgi:hypothetical protein